MIEIRFGVTLVQGVRLLDALGRAQHGADGHHHPHDRDVLVLVGTAVDGALAEYEGRIDRVAQAWRPLVPDGSGLDSIEGVPLPLEETW